jgi:hypothetical protein
MYVFCCLLSAVEGLVDVSLLTIDNCQQNTQLISVSFSHFLGCIFYVFFLILTYWRLKSF